MTDRTTRWVRMIPGMSSIARLLLRLVLAGMLVALAGCEAFDALPEDSESVDGTLSSSSSFSKGRKPAKSTKPGFFKKFRNFIADGTECHATWWTAPDVQPDVWDRLRKNYQFKTVRNERVAVERNWYVRNQAYLNRTNARASRYLYHVANELERRNLPGELALLPIVESAYNPYAYSTSRASGLWQFIPGTAKHLGMDMNWWYDDRRDIVAATDNAINYLVFLRDHYDGDWLKALAAYNAGFGTIDRAVAKNRAKGLPTDYWNLDVPDETKAYVPKMLALTDISKSPDDYGIHWAYIPDLPYFAQVKIDHQLDIPLAADTLGINTDELYLLNPGLSRWATPPGQAHTLLVPIDQANDLQELLANNPSHELMGSSHGRDHANPLFREMESKASSRTKDSSTQSGSRTYKVKKGDTWWSVAKSVGVSSAELQKLNKMDQYEALKIGQTLSIPGKPNSRVEDTISPNKKTAKKSAGKEKTTDTKSSPVKKTASSHTVKKGDTLMQIARVHNVSVDDLAKWNGLNKSKHSLKLGQKIKLQP